MLENVLPSDQLRGLASRKAKADDYKSVRHALVEEEIAKSWLVVKRNKTSTRLKRPKPLEYHFEDRVWVLLYRMGFKFLSGQNGAFLLLNANEPKGPENQIDVVAVDDEVGFAIECKSSERPRKFADFSRDLAKHVNLRDRFTRAIRDGFPTEVKRPTIFAIWTFNIVPTDNDNRGAVSAPSTDS